MFKNRPERPVAFNVGMGIGKALEVGGQYYNDVAVELRNQEALEEARQYQTSERVAGQKFQEGLELDRQKFQTEAARIENERSVEAATDLYDRQVLRDQTLNENAEEAATTAFKREKELTELDNSTVANTETVRFDQLSSEEQLAFANRIGMPTEEMMRFAEESTPVIVGFDSTGKVVNVVGRDSQYKKTVNGWELTSRTSNSQSSTEAENQMDVRLSAFDAGLNEMVQLFGKGFELRGGGAVWNNIAENVWAGNWLVAGNTQQFNAAKIQATEAIFKAFSGAAGSDAEAERYASMLPSYGDTPATIQMKLRMMSNVRVAMERVSGMPPSAFDSQWTPTSQETELLAEAQEQGVRLTNEDLQKRRLLLAEVEQISQANNFSVDQDAFIDPDTGEFILNLPPGFEKYL